MLLVSKAEVYLKVVALVVLAASIVLPALVRAVDYNVGVKVGDWIKYGQFTVNWTGNGTEPSYVTEEKKIQWVRIDVENVSGTTITFNLTTQFNNGTQTPQTQSVDVASNSMSGFFIIASNLKSGDRVTNGTLSPIINQTITGTLMGATRDVNLVNITTTGYGNLTLTSRIYWDQTTGIMVEAYTKAPDYGTPTPDETLPSGYSELSAKATETNMWSADLVGTLPDNLIYIVAGTVAIVIVVGAAVFVRRRKPPSSQKSPPPSPAERAERALISLVSRSAHSHVPDDTPKDRLSQDCAHLC
jgi:hypothetical protein